MKHLYSHAINLREITFNNHLIICQNWIFTESELDKAKEWIAKTRN
jgi:hypothetical protein